MHWFERFATEGLIFPAVMVAFGSLLILRAPSTRRLTDNQLNTLPAWLRWLARLNSAKLQRRCGWATIAFAAVIAISRMAAS